MSKAEEYQERRVEVAGWQVNVASYRLEDEWHSKADNLSPGATLARARGATRDEAEQRALQRAEELLSRTKRHPL